MFVDVRACAIFAVVRWSAASPNVESGTADAFFLMCVCVCARARPAASCLPSAGHIHFSPAAAPSATAKMQNAQGQFVDLYVPRKCSWTNRLIHSIDHASVTVRTRFHCTAAILPACCGVPARPCRQVVCSSPLVRSLSCWTRVPCGCWWCCTGDLLVVLAVAVAVGLQSSYSCCYGLFALGHRSASPRLTPPAASASRTTTPSR